MRITLPILTSIGTSIRPTSSIVSTTLLPDSDTVLGLAMARAMAEQNYARFKSGKFFGKVIPVDTNAEFTLTTVMVLNLRGIEARDTSVLQAQWLPRAFI